MNLGSETIIVSYSLVTLAIYMIILYIGLIPSPTHPLQENVKCVELRLVMLRIVSQNLSVLQALLCTVKWQSAIQVVQLLLFKI